MIFILSIFFLDEATAAIDATTEVKLQTSIKQLTQEDKITTLVIAHRIGTVRDSDRILVLGGFEDLERNMIQVFCDIFRLKSLHEPSLY